MTDATDLFKVEEVLYKRDFTDEQRRKLAKEDKALPDGSYPIETAADLHPAAVLARSGHGDVDAAKVLIARRAKEMKVPNPLNEGDSNAVKKTEATEVRAPLLKTEREGFFLAPLLVPGIPDSHGHVFEKDEIERICHQVIPVYALSKDGAPNVGHGGRLPDVELVENSILRADTVIDGQKVPAGTLLQGYQVHDPLLKEEIERDDICALSWEGRGFLTEID